MRYAHAVEGYQLECFQQGFFSMLHIQPMRLKKHEKPLGHKKLEAKLSSNAVSVYNHIILGAKKTNLNKRHTNDLCI